MKALRIIGLVVAALVVLFLGVNALSDGKVAASASVVVDRPADQILPLVSDFNRYNEWQPWKAKDAAAKYEVASPSSGVGAKMSWDGPVVGVGNNTITAISPTEVQYEVNFIKPWESKMKDFVTLEAEGKGTKVTWYNEADALPFAFRWMAGSIKADVQKDYETGLANLKKLAESQPAAAPADTTAAPSK